MFPIKPRHIKRVSFVNKLYPRLRTSLGVDINALKRHDKPNGDTFCGGRSKNRDLLAFFGLLSSSQRGASTYVQLPLFRRSLKKLADLVERELETIGAQELLMPTLIPKKLWLKSDRIKRQQDIFDHVFQLTDGAQNDLLLGPTYEESVTQLVGDLDSLYEHELPLLLYQTSQKFRYEPNPRFGLLRCNEFMMNDLYSFDSSLAKAEETYAMVSQAYKTIFKRLGLECLRFESDPADIGGKFSHEYQLPISSGEDILIRCRSCTYSYNIEMLKRKSDAAHELVRDKCVKCHGTDLEHIQALELGHTFLLSDTYTKSMGVTIKSSDGQRRPYEMGCYGLGLTRMLGAGVDLFSLVQTGSDTHTLDDNLPLTQIRWPRGVEPFKMGLVSPAKRSKQYQGGSTSFIERMVDRILEISDVDILVENRDKEGIFKRIARLQCIGTPYIIVVGRCFLDNPPQLELLKLNADKTNYEQIWLTEEQLYDYIVREL